MGALTTTWSPNLPRPPSTRKTVAATPEASSVAVNSTVAVSLRQREPMPLAVVTGGVASPGEGEAVGMTLGSATGAAGDRDPGGEAGASVMAADTLTMPGSASPNAAMRISR